MKTRLLGPEKLEVSAIGFGAPTFQGDTPPGGLDNACTVVARAIERQERASTATSRAS